MQPNRNSSSMHSFILGIVVGVLIALLFITKKGRQILRTLTEEGLTKFSEVEDILHAMEENDELTEPLLEEEIIDSGVNEKPAKMIGEEKTENAPSTSSLRSHPLRRLTTARKFFRKPSKR